MKDNQVKLKAYAKINLGLDVIRRLETGYHEVSMIMQTIDLCDHLFIEKAESGIILEVVGSDLPVGEDNLVYRAAQLMMETYNIKSGVHIVLEKCIPIAAGMAGGSSDAAATMKGINQLFELNINLEQLQRVGVTLGADIPYCLQGGTALAEGIGEILTVLPTPPNAYLVVAKPDIMVSTAFVYQNLKLDSNTLHPDISRMKKGLETNSLSEILDTMGNVLESVTVPAFPIIEEIKDCMKKEGALNALMSGSGPTVFGIFDEKEKAQCAYEKIKELELAKEVFHTRWKENGNDE